MNGPQILWVIPVFGGIPITETVRNAWIAMAFLVIVSKILTHNMQMVPGRKQAAVEMAVSTVYNMEEGTMGKDKLYIARCMGTCFALLLTCRISSLFGFIPPTGDLITTVRRAFRR